MVIEIIKLKNKMKINLNDLITRPLGERFYKKVSNMIDNASENEVVLLDFEGINVADPSFLDEFVVKIIRESRMDEKPYFVKLKNFSESTSLNLKSVIESYEKYNNSRIAVATEEIIENSNHCIGNVTEIENEIISFLRINKSRSLNEIADFIEEPIEDAERILHGLVKIGLVRPDETDKKRYHGV